jgi:two-component system sensor histidine kinase KdpD
MQRIGIFDAVRKHIRGVIYALLIVAATTAIRGVIQWYTGITHGASIFLIPVIIAAVNWGVIAAIASAVAGGAAAAYFFYPPYFSFYVTSPNAILNLAMFIVVAAVIGHLAMRLKAEAERARQREIDVRALYEFSRRLAAAFDTSEIHSAIEDHLSTVVDRKVVLFPSPREASILSHRRTGTIVPDSVRNAVVGVAQGGPHSSDTVMIDDRPDSTWLVQAVSPKSLEFGVIAINLGRVTKERVNDLRARVGTALSDATATLERLGVAHAINEAHMRSRTEQLREALVGSVSQELRTPLASIMGAATVLGSTPALANEPRLRALVHDVHSEAERLNSDIQNLLDASRISSEGVTPRMEWADPTDIIHAAIERCRRRLGDRRIALHLPADLPLIHVDAVLVQQALIQIVDNAVKYSPAGSKVEIAAAAHDGKLAITVRDTGVGLTEDEKSNMWNRFFRGDRLLATTSGSGLGLWIAHAFVTANDGAMTASSAGPGEGTTITIELPVAQATLVHVESEADE